MLIRVSLEIFQSYCISDDVMFFLPTVSAHNNLIVYTFRTNVIIIIVSFRVTHMSYNFIIIRTQKTKCGHPTSQWLHVNIFRHQILISQHSHSLHALRTLLDSMDVSVPTKEELMNQRWDWLISSYILYQPHSPM